MIEIGTGKNINIVGEVESEQRIKTLVNNTCNTHWIKLPSMRSRYKRVVIRVPFPSYDILQRNASTDTSSEELLRAIKILQSRMDKVEEEQVEIKEDLFNKMDKYFDYDKDNNTIQFYTNGEPIGDLVELDKEVSWEGWTDG